MTIHVKNRSGNHKLFLRTTVVHCAGNCDKRSTTEWKERDPCFGLRSAAAPSERLRGYISGSHSQHAPSYRTGGVYRQGKTIETLDQRKILEKELKKGINGGVRNSLLE